MGAIQERAQYEKFLDQYDSAIPDLQEELNRSERDTAFLNQLIVRDEELKSLR